MNLCRLCASAHETTRDELINMQDDQTNEISRKVELCCNVFIDLTDLSLPTVVCKQCMKQLNICYDFHEKVNKAQTVLSKLLISRFWPSPWTRSQKRDYKKSQRNKFAKTSNGREDNLETALVTQNYRMPESRVHNQQSNQKNNVIDTKCGNIHYDTGLPSRINELHNTRNMKNHTESNFISSLEADEECVDTSTCGSNGENNLLSKQNALNKDDVVNVIDSDIDENSMDTEISFNDSVDAILAPPISVAEVDLLSLSSPFGKEKKKTNYSQKDLSLDNPDSDLEGNVLAIIDVVSDPEDATSSTDDNYLKEIYNILEKEKDKIYEGLPEAAVKRREKEREESERLEFISTIVKKENIDVPEEVGDKSERDNDTITIKNEKNENPEVNMTETSNDRSNNILTEDIKSQIIKEDYQFMETEVQVNLSDKNPHQYEVTQINGYPEVKTEIFDEQENSDIRQVDDTIRSANTNETFHVHDYNSTKLATVPVNSWKSYQYICCYCSYLPTGLFDLISHSYVSHKMCMKDIIYKCSICSDTTDTYNGFLSHVQMVHYTSLRLRCDVCDILCSDKIEYDLHRHVECVQAERFPDCTRCPYCCITFGSFKTKQIHIRMHLRPKPDFKLKCKLCSMETSSRCALNQHEVTHNSNDFFYL